METACCSVLWFIYCMEAQVITSAGSGAVISVISAVLGWKATLLGAKDVKTNDVAVRFGIRYGDPGAGTGKFNQSR